MISTSELRLGNLFWENYGGYKKVVGIPSYLSIDAIALNNTVVGRYSYDSIEPIPLTKDILEKTELKLYYNPEIDHTTEFWSKGNFTIEIYSGNVLFFYNGNRERVIIKYLHQLQNLYWCLTQTELEIKL